MKKVLLAAFIATVAAQASASTIFTNNSDWQNAVTGITSVGFEGYTSSSSYVYKGTSFTSGGVTFSSNDGVYVIGQNYAESGGAFGFNTGASLFSYSNGVSGALPGSFNAFAVNLRGYLESSTPFSIRFSDGESFSLTATNPAGAFFGVILNNGVNGFTIDPTGEYVDIDNVSYARAAVPEPASAALLGLGLLGFVGSRRKSAKT